MPAGFPSTSSYMAGVLPNKVSTHIQRARVEITAHIGSLSSRISGSVHATVERSLGLAFQDSLVPDSIFLDMPSSGQI